LNNRIDAAEKLGASERARTTKDYLRDKKLGGQEMFIFLSHVPGEAQANFSEAQSVIAGVEYSTLHNSICVFSKLAFVVPGVHGQWEG